MSTLYKTSIKIIVLQLYWFFSIKHGNHFVFPLVALSLFVIDFYVFGKKLLKGSRYIIFSIGLVIIGITMDKTLNFFGIISWGTSFYPLELLGVWIIFPTYYYQIFKKFESSSIISFIIGGIFGTFAYYSGANLNTRIEMYITPANLLAITVLWGAFFSGSIMVSSKLMGNLK